MTFLEVSSYALLLFQLTVLFCVFVACGGGGKKSSNNDAPKRAGQKNIISEAETGKQKNMPSEVDVNLDGMTPTPSKNSKEAIGEDPTKKNEPQTTDIVTMNTKTGKAADKEKSAKEKPKEGEKGDSKEPNNQEGDKKEKSEHKSQEQKKSLKAEQKSAKSLKTDVTQRSVKPKQPKKKREVAPRGATRDEAEPSEPAEPVEQSRLEPTQSSAE